MSADYCVLSRDILLCGHVSLNYNINGPMAHRGIWMSHVITNWFMGSGCWEEITKIDDWIER